MDMKSSNPLLAEFRDKIETRVTQLRADIEEAQKMLDGYQAELDPLVRVLKAMGKTNQAEPLPEVKTPSLVVEKTPAPENTPPVKPDVLPGLMDTEDLGVTPKEPKAVPAKSHRWDHYKLPPRHRKFLERFADRGTFTRIQVREWYKEMNPVIQNTSLDVNVNEVLRSLGTKGIIARIRVNGKEAWRIIP